MTVPDAYKDLLQVLGTRDLTVDDADLQSRLVSDMNAALQLIQSAGEDYYGREEVTLALVLNQASYFLDKGIEEVLDGAQLSDGTQLRKLTSRGQYRNYGTLFKGQGSNTLASGKPEAYWVDPVRDNASDDDVNIYLRLAPAPDSASALLTLLLPVMKEPTELVVADLSDATKKIPIPHKYAQSLFLPIARLNTTRNYYFVQTEHLSGYEEDYKRALMELGLADPRNPVPNESKDRGLETAGASK